MLLTDVLMLCRHSELSITRERYIPVHEIASNPDSDLCNILPAVHG